MQSVSPSSRLNIFRMTARSSIDNFYHILSLSLLSCRQPRETSLEDYIRKRFLMTVRAGICNLIPKDNINTLHLSFPLSIIQLAINSGILSWYITIFLKETLNTSYSLINAAKRCNMSLHLLMIIFDWSHLSYYDLSFCSQQKQSCIIAPDESLHLVFYSSSSVALG